MIITACNIENEAMKEGSLGDMGLFSYNEKDFVADGITKDTSAEEVLRKTPDLIAEAIASKEGMLWAQPTSAAGTFVYVEGTGANMEGLKKYFRNPAFLFLNMEENDDERTFKQVVFAKVKKTLMRTVAVSIPMGDFAESALTLIEEKARDGEIQMQEEDDGIQTEFQVEFGFEIPKKEVDFEK